MTTAIEPTPSTVQTLRRLAARRDRHEAALDAARLARAMYERRIPVQLLMEEVA